jgi:ubiquinone/menaquinone biosynthesis C-methylase UbiE
MTEIRSAIDFYSRHPISAGIVLAKLEAARGTLDGLRPEELFSYDQDHYGGLAATDALAAAAAIGPGSHVADFCAGLGGPARYLAHRYGVRVTGIELTPARVAGAAELTRLVGLADRVTMIEGDVTHVPLADAAFDAVISQEALLHVPDVPRALAEAHRLLRPGGHLAFTDWIAHCPLSEPDRDLMWRGMAMAGVRSIPAYAELLRAAGFVVERTDDLTSQWAPILAERLAMYRKLRSEAAAAGTPAGHDAFYESYVRFVALIEAAHLGGGRFVARKPI